MLYHSFACSRISYGITAWGTAADKYLKEIETKLNNIVRTITWNKKFSRVTQLYKNLKQGWANSLYGGQHLKKCCSRGRHTLITK